MRFSSGRFVSLYVGASQDQTCRNQVGQNSSRAKLKAVWYPLMEWILRSTPEGQSGEISIGESDLDKPDEIQFKLD